MGQSVTLVRISAEELKAIQTDKKRLADLVAAFETGELEGVKLNKSIEGIVHVLYRVVAEDHKAALHKHLFFTMLDGCPETVSVYYLTGSPLEQLRMSLATVDEEKFRSMIDPGSLNFFHIFPDVWETANGYNAKKYLADHYLMLQQTISDATDKAQVVLGFAD